MNLNQNINSKIIFTSHLLLRIKKQIFLSTTQNQQITPFDPSEDWNIMFSWFNVSNFIMTFHELSSSFCCFLGPLKTIRNIVFEKPVQIIGRPATDIALNNKLPSEPPQIILKHYFIIFLCFRHLCVYVLKLHVYSPLFQ